MNDELSEQLPGDLAHQLVAAAKHVAAGDIIAYPTESCFGLGCHPDNQSAIQGILNIKQRAADQGLILVAGHISQFAPYVDFEALTETQRARVEQSWPGPVSWLIPARAGCEPLLRGRHQTLAVRLSAYAPVQALCRQADTALVSTSANRHSQPALTTADAVREQLGDEVAYIIDAPVEGLARPSQIIDAITQQTIRT